MNEGVNEWRVFVLRVYNADWFGCNSIGWNDKHYHNPIVVGGPRQEESPVFSLVNFFLKKTPPLPPFNLNSTRMKWIFFKNYGSFYLNFDGKGGGVWWLEHIASLSVFRLSAFIIYQTRLLLLALILMGCLFPIEFFFWVIFWDQKME